MMVSALPAYNYKEFIHSFFLRPTLRVWEVVSDLNSTVQQDHSPMGTCPTELGRKWDSGEVVARPGTCLPAPRPRFPTSQVLHCELEAMWGLINNGCRWVLKSIKRYVVVRYC